MQWKKPQVNEALATLYLRLNGYFTTGLIIHSPEWGRNLTEVDCLAIRHPDHSQPERGVESSSFLAIRPGEVDLIVCEVKSCPKGLMFNEPLRSNKEALCSVLRWAGIFSEEHVKSVADGLQPLLQGDIKADTVRNGVLEGRCRVRPLLCCPPCSEADCKGRWCLVGTEIVRFVRQCLNPNVKRDSCSTRYPFQQWGLCLAPLVTYFKEPEEPNLPDLYKKLGAT